MNKIQKLIIDTYSSKPKHFTQMLKRNPEVLAYLDTHASHLPTFLEQLYFVAYGKSGICPRGNTMQLKTFSGYTFCGKTGSCACASESVSKSMTDSWASLTVSDKKSINDKRIATTLKLHGVTNNGQTPVAKARHDEFYSDTAKVTAVTDRIKTTKFEVHGNANYNNRLKSEETCLSRYDVKNAWLRREDAQNPLLSSLKNKDALLGLYPRMSVADIASHCNVHTQTVYHYLRLHNLREPYRSSFELEIVHYLESLGVTNIMSNKRNIIGKELDIFLPDYNLAIEYNGIYWHCDKMPNVTRSYHYNKFKACEDIGIELFTIFGDSWDSKKGAWKAKIKHKLGLSDDQKVFARKTVIEEISKSEAAVLLNEHHVQGNCKSEYILGLRHLGTLVAVMTFSKKRVGIGKDRGDNAYELVRYATAVPVVGGASKLLAAFIKRVNPKLIYSYSDNRYSTGNLYKTLGFSLEGTYKTGYWYHDPNTKTSYHRFNFTKGKLVKQGFDETKTAFEIMDERGFLRIWSCGSRTWVLKFP